MSNRYRVGNTHDIQHVVRDDKQGVVIALCLLPSHAQGIADALNAMEEGPKRSKLTGSPVPPETPPAECVDVATRHYLYKLTGYLVRRCEEMDGDPTDIPEPPEVSRTESAPTPSSGGEIREIKTYLADLFSFLCQAGTDEWHADDVPAPAWLP